MKGESDLLIKLFVFDLKSTTTQSTIILYFKILQLQVKIVGKSFNITTLMPSIISNLEPKSSATTHSSIQVQILEFVESVFTCVPLVLQNDLGIQLANITVKISAKKLFKVSCTGLAAIESILQNTEFTNELQNSMGTAIQSILLANDADLELKTQALHVLAILIIKESTAHDPALYLHYITSLHKLLSIENIRIPAIIALDSALSVLQSRTELCSIIPELLSSVLSTTRSIEKSTRTISFQVLNHISQHFLQSSIDIPTLTTDLLSNFEEQNEGIINSVIGILSNLIDSKSVDYHVKIVVPIIFKYLSHCETCVQLRDSLQNYFKLLGIQCGTKVEKLFLDTLMKNLVEYEKAYSSDTISVLAASSFEFISSSQQDLLVKIGNKITTAASIAGTNDILTCFYVRLIGHLCIIRYYK